VDPRDVIGRVVVGTDPSRVLHEMAKPMQISSAMRKHIPDHLLDLENLAAANIRLTSGTVRVVWEDEDHADYFFEGAVIHRNDWVPAGSYNAWRTGGSGFATLAQAKAAAKVSAQGALSRTLRRRSYR
jgi:hypothetical protein